MKTLARFVALGILIKVVAFLGFVGVSRTPLAFPGTDIVFYSLIVAMILYLIAATRRLSGWQLMILPAILTAGFVTIFHTLSFIWFPGIMKGLIPFSQSHLAEAEYDCQVLIAGYFVTIGLILLIKHCLNRRSSSSRSTGPTMPGRTTQIVPYAAERSDHS